MWKVCVEIVYTPWSHMFFTVLISVKPTVTHWISVGTFCTKFHLNLIKKCRKCGQNFICPLSKVWLSLYKFLSNCHCGTTFKELLYQIKWKSDKQETQWLWSPLRVSVTYETYWLCGNYVLWGMTQWDLAVYHTKTELCHNHGNPNVIPWTVELWWHT
jgi:hypothetical protein